MKPCKLLFLAQSILIIIIVSTYVIALGDEEGRREYTAISHKADPKVAHISAAQIEKWRQAKDYKAFNDAIGDYLDSIGIDELTYPCRRRDFDGIIWEQRT